MSDSQGGAGRREVAFRLFAAEYDDADLSYSESDEERAPNYVVTPTGARVNRVFVVGVLTEVENVSEDYLRARIVDPTGPFVVYAGQYQPEAMNFLERAEPPLFVAVTGKARTFQPEDSDRVYTSIRPESINEVDAATRDRWVVQAADQTIDRVTRTAEAKLTGLEGEQLMTALLANDVEDGLADATPIALDHYGTTGDYLTALRELALDAIRVVAGERDEVAGFSASPADGTDDSLESLAERSLDIQDVETDVADVDAVANAPEPDTESSPTDEEIDEAVEAADLDADEDETSPASHESTEPAAAVESDESAAVESDESAAVATEDSGAVATEAPISEATEDSVAEPSGESTMEDAGESVEDEPAVRDQPDTEQTVADDGDLEEFDGEFDLDDGERAEIEEEYGTEFQSGSEVEEPGEADIETPTTEPPAEPGEADALDDAVEGGSPGGGESDDDLDAETEDANGDDEFDAGTEAAADAYDGEQTVEDEVETAGDIALDDAVMDAMVDLDDGDGADRDAVVAEVVQATGADPGEVEDAIQEALMDGRCYEPNDETLKAI